MKMILTAVVLVGLGTAGMTATARAQANPTPTPVGETKTSASSSGSADGISYFPAAQVSAGFEKGGALFDGKDRNYTVMTARREKSGPAELHEKDTDVFYIVDGTATFVTGGKLLEAKNSGPSEVRGSGIEGGESRRLSKGDVIIIPAGVPHWFKDVPATFLYFVVKARP